jgi:putative ABC transport system substrate-binding protein
MAKNFVYLLLAFLFLQCKSEKGNKDKEIPTIGFLDAFEDETLKEAKRGFFDALEKNGFSEEKGTLKVEYRNAQNDLVNLTQSCDYLIAQNVKLIGTNSTLSTITASKKTKTIPIFMMVAPSPLMAGLNNPQGQPPSNLSGVYEELGYIDTSVALIRNFFKEGTKIGILYNQSEPQSVQAFERLSGQCNNLNFTPVGVAVNNSSEVKMGVEALFEKGIEAFFAMPDNTIFAAFEIIQKICFEKKTPIFTSEAGLVKRGAMCAYCADI